jgi:hypothetical protein
LVELESAPEIGGEVAEFYGLPIAEVKRALVYMQEELNNALLNAGYNRQSAQDLGYVAEGLPPKDKGHF